MKRIPSIVAFPFLLLPVTGIAGTNVDLNINIGSPPVVIHEPSPRTTVIVEEEPEFVYAPRFGFYIGFGIPLDIIYLDGYFWLWRDSGWHRSSSYAGPWYRVRHIHLPPEIRRHDVVTIREYRDREYVIFQREKDRYPHRHFRPDREWHEKRRHERAEEKWEKRRDHDEWKHEKRREKNEWKRKERRERDEWSDRRHDDGREGRSRHERERRKDRD